MNAMINTAMAAEITPSPRSSRRRGGRWAVARVEERRRSVVAVVGCMIPPVGSGCSTGGKGVKGGQERHGDEDHSGNQGGYGDGDPHLFSSPFDELRRLAVYFLAALAGLDGHQATEV